MTTSCRFCLKQEVLHISTLVSPNDMKLRLLLPHEPLRLCAKYLQMTTRWRSLNLSISYLHIGWSFFIRIFHRPCWLCKKMRYHWRAKCVPTSRKTMSYILHTLLYSYYILQNKAIWTSNWIFLSKFYFFIKKKKKEIVWEPEHPEKTHTGIGKAAC